MDQEEVDKILKKIDTETWNEIFYSLKLEATAKKASYITTFQQAAYESGARQLALQLKLDVLKAFASDIKLPEETVNTKNSISKRFAEKVRETGLEDTLKGAKKDNLEAILDLLGVKKADTAKAQAAQVADEIRSVGIALLFSKLNLSLLRDVCDELKIDSTPTSSNAQLVAAIIGQPLEKRERPPPAKITKNKPELVKGAATDNIVLHYTKPELEEFCTKNKISITLTGRKREIAKKIVGFLNGEPQEEKEGRKAKRAKTEKTEKPKEPKEKKGKGGKGGKAKDKPKKETKGTKGTKEKETKDTKETKETTEETTTEANGEAEKTKKTPPPKSPKSTSPKSTKRKTEDEEADKNKSPKKTKADAGDKFLKDTVFAIAGKFEGETHSALEREIKKYGGKVADNISTDTTHLLVPDIAATSTKIQKAKESNVKVVALDFIRKSK